MRTLQANLPILIAGGRGYIGSALSLHLAEKGFRVDSIDLEWFGRHGAGKHAKRDVSTLTKKELSKYGAIIFLAGHSSVKMCEGNMLATFRNNVENFVSLLEKVSPKQKFIYASSSSVYNGISGTKGLENENLSTNPTTWYDLTKREIDWYAALSGKEYYGLRLGTVNGASPHTRVDLMINAMHHSARTKKEVLVFNGNSRRPILGMSDLCRAVEAILASKQKPGIYNLASFNSTAEKIAKKVASLMEVPLRHGKPPAFPKNIKLHTKNYDFSISTKKFERVFGFRWHDSIASIVESLEKAYDTSAKTTRHEPHPYDTTVQSARRVRRVRRA